MPIVGARAAVQSDSTRHAIYQYLLGDYLLGRFKSCGAPRAFELAGMALQAAYGNYEPGIFRSKFSMFSDVVPDYLSGNLTENELFVQLAAAYEKPMGLSARTVELKFIEAVQSMPEYGLSTFKLRTRNDELVVLGVNLHGVCFFSSEANLARPTAKVRSPGRSVLGGDARCGADGPMRAF